MEVWNYYEWTPHVIKWLFKDLFSIFKTPSMVINLSGKLKVVEIIFKIKFKYYFGPYFLF